MNEKQKQQLMSQIPEGEKITKMYTAFEGDRRVVTEDKNHKETRYKMILDREGNITLEKD